MNKTKMKALAGMGAAGLLLSMSSTAYACTVFRGRMEATGNSTTGVTSSASGNNSGMGYCSGTLVRGAKSTNSSTATVTVGVPAAASCNGSTFTKGATYSAYFLGGKVFGPVKQQGVLRYSRIGDCMRGSAGTNYLGPAGTADATTGLLAATTHTLKGNGTLNTVNANPAFGEDGGVCLTQDSALIGNQVPLQIVTV